MSVSILVAATASAVCAAAIVARFVPRRVRLARRVRPYAVAARSSLGQHAGMTDLAAPDALVSATTIGRLLQPVAELMTSVGQRVFHTDDADLVQRLQHAGLYAHLPAGQRVAEYRIRQLATALVMAAGLGAGAALFGQPAGVVLLVAGLGLVAGVSRTRGRVERAIEERRRRMCVELYTVNQLLALHIRVGGGVTHAVQHVVSRGTGQVIGELHAVLARHRGGRPVASALESAAAQTPEPNAARTYRLLATGVTFGTDLSDGLRALSEDIRDQRTEALKRTATKRRAAPLLPIIAILAPIMLLFIAAPLPSIVFGGM